ncbi:MAG: hypothetical protein JSS82_03305 [Bacteroidetes bacterium]|nr:hypothetical protein [Bacteroidota bacterium]
MSRIFINSELRRHINKYPAPKYLNYSWGFGSSLGLTLALQIFTGILLALYYRPSAATAFSDVITIIFDVNHGYFVKYLHLNGASLIFLLMYLHLLRGVYYRSYVRAPYV